MKTIRAHLAGPLHYCDRPYFTMSVFASYICHEPQKSLCLTQVEVCTVYACLKSDAVIGTTAEAVAQDLSPPVPSALGTDSVRVAWKEPGSSNGIILRYDLMRKARLPCGQE